VLGGYSAAALLGADCAPRNAPAEVIVPHRFVAHRGLRVRRDHLAEQDVLETGDVRVTTPLRTAWDLARRLTLVEAVVAVDALARRRRSDVRWALARGGDVARGGAVAHADALAHGGGAFTPADLLVKRAVEPGARGCRRLDRVVALADPRAESPPETRLRAATSGRVAGA
jgi:hypothetical protein